MNELEKGALRLVKIRNKVERRYKRPTRVVSL